MRGAGRKGNRVRRPEGCDTRRPGVRSTDRRRSYRHRGIRRVRPSCIRHSSRGGPCHKCPLWCRRSPCRRTHGPSLRPTESASVGEALADLPPKNPKGHLFTHRRPGQQSALLFQSSPLVLHPPKTVRRSSGASDSGRGGSGKISTRCFGIVGEWVDGEGWIRQSKEGRAHSFRVTGGRLGTA